AARRQVRHADVERIVELRIEDAELGHPPCAKSPLGIGDRRNDVGVIDLRGEWKRERKEEKRDDFVSGSFHSETFPGTGNASQRSGGWVHSRGFIAGRC